MASNVREGTVESTSTSGACDFHLATERVEHQHFRGIKTKNAVQRLHRPRPALRNTSASYTRQRSLRPILPEKVTQDKLLHMKTEEAFAEQTLTGEHATRSNRSLRTRLNSRTVDLTDKEVKVYGRVLVQLRNERLDGQNLRMRPSGRLQPVPVQVESQVRAAVVTVHYPLFRFRVTWFGECLWGKVLIS